MNKYGPNTIKVRNYIEALKSISSADLNEMCLTDWAIGEAANAAQKLASVRNSRLTEITLARADAESAMEGRIADQAQIQICTFLAEWFVTEDLVDVNARSFMGLYLINQLVDLKILHNGFRNEDWAIRKFCDGLSKFDDELATIETQPDERGTGGKGLPDFIIRRKGDFYTVEHTSLESFAKQFHYSTLWRSIDRARLEGELALTFPNNWIKVSVPMEQLVSKRFVEQIKFDGVLEGLKTAIANTPTSFDAGSWKTHELASSQLVVAIAVDDRGGYDGVWIDGVVPTTPEEIRESLKNNFLRAFETKTAKLARAKATGGRTILLIDSQDIAFTNIHILADAFQNAEKETSVDLFPIDEIYLLYLFGSNILAPVKLGSRLYPDLPEFNGFIRKLLGI